MCIRDRFVFSKNQDATAEIKTSGTDGKTAVNIHSEGTGGAVLTVQATKSSNTAHAVLVLEALPISGGSSGNAEMTVTSKHQNMKANFLASGNASKADMKVQSDGSGGASFTVLSTNTATSSNARFDLHAKPGTGTTSGNAEMTVFSESQNVDVEIKTTGTTGMHAHHRLVSTGTQGSIMTITSTKDHVDAVSRLEVLADAGFGASSGNAEMNVFSSHQHMLAEFKTSGSAGHAHFNVETEGSDGAIMTVTSTNPNISSHAILQILASPEGASTSGDARFNMKSLHQDATLNVESGGGDMTANFQTTYSGGKADMKVESAGTGGAILTVLSTNPALSSHAIFDLHAVPTTGSTSGEARMSISSLKDHSSIAMNSGEIKDSTITYHATNADTYATGLMGASTSRYEIRRDAQPTPSPASNYRGSVSVTVGGRLCQKWTLQTPHTHSYNATGDHNYCRDPDGSGTLWCHTIDPDTLRENCDPSTASTLMWLDGSGNMELAGGVSFVGDIVAGSIYQKCDGGDARELNYTSRHCYEYYTSPKSFYDAYQICARDGGHLVTLRDDIEEALVTTLVNDTSVSLWLGYTDAEVSTQWRWINGDVSFVATGVYNSWSTGEPITGAPPVTPRCAIKLGASWYSRACPETHPFMCERESPR
eukprot:TRINITY_DN2660_c0_g1_i1.p1 TRINITY_DN2660_c0_g1~~TRINITY_DN2660_c0_g1_i1.p1  ORF type:complete len:652 (+),score=152.45 TRINITY_DN2660_c0_g1_i1:78-2033(+)